MANQSQMQQAQRQGASQCDNEILQKIQNIINIYIYCYHIIPLPQTPGLFDTNRSLAQPSAGTDTVSRLI